MAILKEVRLHNFAQHKKMWFELGSGITSIVGPMGSGKTNAMLCIPMALCSDYGMYPGVKASLVRRGSTEPSFCKTVWLLDDGTVLELVRFLRGGESHVIVNNERLQLRREADITKFCEERLGYDSKSFLSQHCISQNRIDGIVEEQPTDRIKAMAALFDVQDLLLPSVRDLTAEVSWLQGKLCGSGDFDSASVLFDKRQVAVAYSLFIRKTWECQAKLPSEEAVREAQAIITQVNTREQLKQQRQTISGNLSKQQAALEVAELNQQKLEAKLAKVLEKQKSFEQYRNDLKRKQLLEAAVVRETAAVHNANVAVVRCQDWLRNKPVQPSLIKYSQEDLTQLSDELNEIVRHLRLLDEGLSVCDHCGSSIDLSKVDSDSLEARRAELQSQRRLHLESAEAWSSYSRQLAHYEEKVTAKRTELRNADFWLEAKNAELASTQVELETLVIPDGLPSLDMVDQYVEQCRLDTQESVKLTIQKQLAVQSSNEELDRVRKALSEINHKWESSFERSVALVQSQQDILAVLRDVHNQKIRLQSERRMLLQQLEIAKAKERESEHYKKWLNHVEEASIKVKPKGMARAVLATLMNDVVEPVSAICRYLNLPFIITYDQNLELVALHNDGSEEKARCLSGGQRSCVALAFWFAKLINMRGGLKILLVDEPASSLDEQGVADFADLLFELAPLAAKKNCQIILSTHHKQLQSCAQYKLSFYEDANV